MFSVMSPLSHVSSSDSGFMFLSGRIQTQRLKVMAMYVTNKVCSQCPGVEVLTGLDLGCPPELRYSSKVLQEILSNCGKAFGIN